jgi:hypothetical protein
MVLAVPVVAQDHAIGVIYVLLAPGFELDDYQRVALSAVAERVGQIAAQADLAQHAASS